MSHVFAVRRLRPEKKGIRVLGIAESFSPGQQNSVLAGIVIRRDRLVDGIVYGRCTVEGDDATDAMIEMFAALQRNDINCILVDGQIISLYNIIDGGIIAEKTGIPVIAITFEETSGLENAITGRYGKGSEKLKRYMNLGKRDEVRLRTGKRVFIRVWGTTKRSAVSLLNSFTVQGAMPEPTRLAKLAARAASRML